MWVKASTTAWHEGSQMLRDCCSLPWIILVTDSDNTAMKVHFSFRLLDGATGQKQTQTKTHINTYLSMVDDQVEEGVHQEDAIRLQTVGVK